MISHDQVITAFVDRLAQHGLRLTDPSDVRMDGRWHRADVEGDRRRSANLAYKIFFDDRPAGYFKDHKRGIEDTFSVSNGVDLSPEQRAEAQRVWRQRQAEREAEQQREYELAAERATTAYAAAQSDPSQHPYLIRKGLPATRGVRQDADGNLVIPIYSDFGRLCSLQTIGPDGEKLYFPGGRMAGSFHPIPGTDRTRVLVCEGYATGVALVQATGHSIACAMHAGNLPAVVAKMRARYPDREIVVAADDDRNQACRACGSVVYLPEHPQRCPECGDYHRARNAGIEQAQGSGVRWIAPPFEREDTGTDWDDYLRATEGGHRQLLAALDEVADAAGERSDDAGGCEVLEATGPASADDATRAPRADAPERPVLRPALSGTLLEPPRANLTETVDDPTADDLPDQYSEDNVALAFSRRFTDDLRWVQSWGRWMQWDGARWIHDESLLAFDLVRKTCRSVAATARTDVTLNPKQQAVVANRYGQASTVSAVERMARADRRHAATPDQWDADIWVINTPDGVIDLHTGSLRAPVRNDHMTKITRVGPGGDCPTWRRFLEVATQGDTGLQGFLQRMAGYALTGSTRDHALFFVYGTGGNGKGTFLNTLTHILGDYAQPASMDVFTESRGDRHPTELASLRGARMVSAQETEEGKRWAEAKIKALTGGDPIRARFMRMDEFTFIPQFKLIIAGNHKPGLRNVDEAIRRRLHLIPFTAEISPADKDPALPDKLLAEAGGILQWAVEGCIAWQREGLRPPASVLAATDEYLEQQDTLQSWIDECCEMGTGLRSRSSDLYRSFKSWAERNGEFPLPLKRWVAAMESRGMSSRKTGGVMMYDGLRVIPNESPGWGPRYDDFD